MIKFVTIKFDIDENCDEIQFRELNKPQVLMCIIRWHFEGPYHLTRSAEVSKSQRKSKYLSDWREGDTRAKLQFFEICKNPLSKH